MYVEDLQIYTRSKDLESAKWLIRLLLKASFSGLIHWSWPYHSQSLSSVTFWKLMWGLSSLPWRSEERLYVGGFYTIYIFKEPDTNRIKISKVPDKNHVETG